MLPQHEASVTTAVKPPGFDLAVGAAEFRRERNLSSRASTMPAEPDIQTLMRAVRRGDAEAFSRFYDLYSFRVYKFLIVLARGDEDLAREVCQVVFIKLAKRCDVFEEERRLWAWLCVLAKNTFIDERRRGRRRNRFLSLDELSAEPNGDVKTQQRLSEILREALAGLSPDERELIQAAYVDQRPLRELADEAGITYKAVESRLGRLRQKLKEQVLKDLRHENKF